jgi:hypothetical protein
MEKRFLQADEDVIAGQFVTYWKSSFRVARSGDEHSEIGMALSDCHKGEYSWVQIAGALPPYAWIENNPCYKKEVSHSSI